VVGVTTDTCESRAGLAAKWTDSDSANRLDELLDATLKARPYIDFKMLLWPPIADDPRPTSIRSLLTPVVFPRR